MKFAVLQFFSWPGKRVPLATVYERAFQRIEECSGLGFHAGVEHEEEDPDLGQERDRLTGLDEPEDSRSYQHPDDELAHDRRQP